eukprot:scaffold13505_cov69-Cylindrotheca_fusiformis.AAC.5
MENPNMDERTKRTGSTKGRKKNRKFFVYTNETKNSEIPRKKLTHLRVDSSVTEIPASAFEECKALVQVQFPDSLTRIKESAFCGCSNLKSVQFVSPDGSLVETCAFNHVLEDGVILFPERAMLQIDRYAFAFCHSLQKVIVCSVSTRLGVSSFWNCHGLISARLPEGLREIEQGLFQSCTSLTTVQIPSSVVKINDYAFVVCRNLTSFDLPHGLLEIGGKSFFRCSAIETLEIPSTVSTIGRNAFELCERLKSIKLPATLEIVEYALFSGCRSLEFIEIPTAVKVVGDLAFDRCSSLSHIRIPPSVVNIGRRAFRGCSSLISVELPEGTTLGEDNGTSNFSILGCSSLVNVALPTLMGDLDEGEEDLLQNLKYGNVVDGYGELRLKLKHRFESSPLNKLCYYQSYYSTEDAMVKLSFLMDKDPLAATTETDEFGMIPLHILSLSQTPNSNMLTAVINAGHPDHIFRGRDAFGSTPMDYLCLNKMPSSIQVIREVVRTRVHWLGLDLWKSDILQAVDEALAVDWSIRRRAIGVVYFKLATYELKEILSLVELYLWQLKIAEICCKEKAQRQSCKINSGASIVIPNVLLFLNKFAMDDCLVQAP